MHAGNMLVRFSSKSGDDDEDMDADDLVRLCASDDFDLVMLGAGLVAELLVRPSQMQMLHRSPRRRPSQ